MDLDVHTLRDLYLNSKNLGKDTYKYAAMMIEWVDDHGDDVAEALFMKCFRMTKGDARKSIKVFRVEAKIYDPRFTGVPNSMMVRINGFSESNKLQLISKDGLLDPEFKFWRWVKGQFDYDLVQLNIFDMFAYEFITIFEPGGNKRSLDDQLAEQVERRRRLDATYTNSSVKLYATNRYSYTKLFEFSHRLAELTDRVAVRQGIIAEAKALIASVEAMPPIKKSK